METFDMADCVTGIVAQTARKHDNDNYRNSQACWWTSEAFKPLQDALGVTEDTTDAVSATVLLFSKAGIVVSKEAFNRALTAHQAKPAKADKTPVLSESDKYAIDYMRLLKSGKKHKEIIAEIGDLPQ
jgi:hypothetical protein